MIVIAVLLIAASAALAVGVLLASAEPTQLDVYMASVNSTVAGVFFTGLVTGVVFLLGIAMLVSSIRRKSRRQKERRAALQEQQRKLREAEEERQRLEREREQLRERLSSNIPESPEAQGTPPRP